MAFKTSINIKFDIGNEEFIKRYIPTPSHAEALKGIMDGFTKDANRSHIIIGPYGTGKSLLATVISSIVSKMINKKEVNKLVSKFNQVDDNIANQIKQVSSLEVNYIPILLSGNEGRFRQVVLTNVVKELKSVGIDILLPGLSEKIVDAINLWKKNFPDTYSFFCSKLIEDGKELSGWLDEIKRKNEKELKYFAKIYPLLTSGASFDIDYDHSFISQMEYINKVIQENNLGIIIVYDEFGRFLQGLNSEKFNETMQDIQDFAELINRTETMQLLLITHKSLRQYFGGFNEEISKEFQRIEKRFRQYFIQSDQATFLRIAESIVTENIKQKPLISSNQFKETQILLRKFPLFPSLNQTEREKIVIEGVYPLHPIALFMLPNLTRVFGQNERTLFTFLESNETGGLLNFVAKTSGYYLAFQLFDYFFPDYYNGDFGVDVSEHFVLYRKAIARVPDEITQKQLSINIIKFISLWNLCGLQNEHKLTNEFLLFAFHSEANKVTELLPQLIDNKIIRFNRINGYWEIFSGSSIDIYEKIDQQIDLIQMSDDVIQTVLYKNLRQKFFSPEEYNDVKGMTRYAAVKLLVGSQLLNPDQLQSTLNADITIFYVFSDDENDKNIEKQLSNLSKEKDVIFVLHPYPIETIKKDIYNCIALDVMRGNKLLIAEDKGVKEELKILYTEARHTVEKYLSEINEYTEGFLWFVDGKRGSISNELQLSSVLSKKCYQLFKLTPIVLNESFNRTFVTSPQKNGAIKVVDCILENYNLEQFGITGNGPEYSIYASIFKNNNRFDLNINTLDYSSIENETFIKLREELIEVLDTTPSGNFQNIIKLFTNPPFGIRKPVIPILLVSLLRDRWNEFMLYRNGMFVPGLNGEKLFDIIVETGSENYEYVYEQIDDQYIEFYNQIESIFGEFQDARLHAKSRLINTCGTLLKWIRTLPRFTQMTEQVNTNFKWLRDCIKKTEINPQENIGLIFKKYSGKTNKLLLLKKYAHEHIKHLKKELVTRVKETTKVNNYKELVKWATEENDKVLSNKLINGLYKVTTDQNIDASNWIDSFTEDYVGVKIEEWSDATYNMFISQIEHDYKTYHFINNEDPLKSRDFVSIQINNSKKVITKVDLSVKSKTIFNNLEMLLNSAGRNVPKQELDFLVFKLLEKHLL